MGTEFRSSCSQAETLLEPFKSETLLNANSSTAGFFRENSLQFSKHLTCGWLFRYILTSQINRKGHRSGIHSTSGTPQYLQQELQITGNNLPVYISLTYQNSGRTILKIKMTGKLWF